MRQVTGVLFLLVSLCGMACADTGPITYGQTLTGTLAAAAGEQDVYTFTAPANGRVLVRVVSVSGQVGVGVDLFRVGTGSVGTAGSIGPVATIEQATILSGESYEIRVPPSATGAGYPGQGYRVFLQSTTDPVGAPAVALGATPTGSIDQVGEMDFFTIAATGGDEILFTVNRTSGVVDPSAVVYFPGAACSPSYGLLDGTNNPTVQTQCLFDTTGTYAFAIEDVDDAATGALDNVETGGYGFTVECFSGGCLSATTTTTAGGTTTIPDGTTTTTLVPPTEQLVPGTKLLLKDKTGKPQKRLLIVTVKDDALTLGEGNGSADDPRTFGAALRVRSTAGGFDTTYALPAAQWKAIGADGAGKGYRYADKSRSVGPVASLMVKPKRLMVIAKGAELDANLATDPNPIDVVFTMGGARYCAQFGGDVSFKATKKLTARKAPAPFACP